MGKQRLAHYVRQIIVILTLLMTVGSLSVFPTAAHGAGSTQEGWFNVVHWTSRPQSGDLAQNIYTLTFDDGHSLTLDLAPTMLEAAGGLQALRGQRVVVSLADADAQSVQPSGATVKPLSIKKIAPPAGKENMLPKAVSGSQPWVTLLCNFPGTPVGHDTDTIDYFQEMYSPDFPGMDHYWRQQSYGAVNLLGSNTYGSFTLPHNQTYYIPTPGSGQISWDMLNQLFLDCTAAADPTVNFANYVGINLMFNGNLDCCAWGGGEYALLDGVWSWRATWNPPWSWRDITVVAHEVGHGFGLPHGNNYDGDNNPYDNPWDVMSDTWTNCQASNDPNYGCLGQHTNAYYKDYLGWFGTKREVIAVGNTSQITLDNTSIQEPDDYQIITVPVNGSSSFFYTIEARQNTNSGYDAKLLGKAVIISEVNIARNEPAWLVGGTTDALSKSVTTNPDGAWLVGETFSGNGVSISVISQTSDGFVVQVNNDDNGVVAPNQLAATVISGAEIDLTWDDNSGDETGYKLERSPDGVNNWVEIASLAANSSAYNDVGLECSTQYYYRVRAVRSGLYSSYAKKVNATTSSAPCGGNVTPTATFTPSATPPPTSTSTPVAGLELLVNGGMETDTDANKLPDNWTVKNPVGDKLKCNSPEKSISFNGACAFMFKGGTGENTALVQNVDITGVTFTTGFPVSLHGFFSASNPAASAKYIMIVTYADGTVEKTTLVVDVTTGYERATTTYTLLSGDVTQIKVQIKNKSTAGKIYADDLSLVRDNI